MQSPYSPANQRSSPGTSGPRSGSQMTGANRPGSTRSSACATAAAALRCPPPVSPMRKSNGRGGCSGLAIAHLCLFFSSDVDAARRKGAVDGFPPGEQAMPVMVGDDPRTSTSTSARAARGSRQSRSRLPAHVGRPAGPGQEAVLARVHELAERARVDRDHRQPARHRLHRRQGLQLGLGRDREHVGQPVQAGQVGAGDEAEEADPLGDAAPAGERRAACPRPGPCPPGRAPVSGRRPCGGRRASISTSARFSGLSLPTDRISGRPAGSAYRRRSASSARPGREALQVDAVRHGLRRRPQPVVAQQPQRGRGRRGDPVAAVGEPGQVAVEAASNTRAAATAGAPSGARVGLVRAVAGQTLSGR